jgi:hypothetical protein
VWFYRYKDTCPSSVHLRTSLKKHKTPQTFLNVHLTRTSSAPGEASTDLTNRDVFSEGLDVWDIHRLLPRRHNSRRVNMTLASIQCYRLYIKNSRSFTSNFTTCLQDWATTHVRQHARSVCLDYCLPDRDTKTDGLDKYGRFRVNLMPPSCS